MIKKFIFSIILFFIFIFDVSAVGGNKIYSIDIDVYLDEYGNASVTEKWDVDGDDGTEWYKCMYNLENSKISDFKVSMDGKELQYKNNWDVNGSLKSKRGYYGINYAYDGPELCFGKYDYKRHEFTLSYKLSNMIFNTSDSQVLYFNFIDSLSDVDFENFSIQISSFYKFPLELDVWGYGNKGYAYVEDGVIKALNDGEMGEQYAVLLVKFPLNTFKTENSYVYYPDFNSVYEKSLEDSYEHDYGSYESDESSVSNFIESVFISIFMVIAISCAFVPRIFSHIFSSKSDKLRLLTSEYDVNYAYKENVTITKDNTNYFRDIPCNNDIFLADALVRMNKFNNKKSNIIGVFILKWIREGKIVYKVVSENGKDVKSLDMTKKVNFKINIEKELFDVMYKASNDGILEIKEFEKWCKSNYYDFLELFSELKNATIKKLINEKHVYKNDGHALNAYYIMDDVIYEESKKLFGLKMFLEDFSRIDTREVMEVRLWDEYLMFAYLFGIADKVSSQLKRLYPDITEELKDCDYFDIDLIDFIDNISRKSYSSAETRSKEAIKRSDTFASVLDAVADYASTGSGGGGFSRGGGGGGSFGGGGGGSR